MTDQQRAADGAPIADPSAPDRSGDTVGDAPAGAPTTAPAVPVPAVDRRRFVRSIAGESVTAAGRLAGISGMLLGSVAGAAKAAGDTFSALGGTTATPTGAASTAAPSSTIAPIPVPAAPGPVAAAPLRVSDADRAVLASLRLGLLATNQPGTAPAVGVVRFLFDGETFRIPGRSATARTGNLQRDPFAALTLIDPGTGDALLLAGRTRILYGTAGRDAAAEVLSACDVPLPDGWDRADTRGEPILVVLEPQRLIRRPAADERP